MVTRIDVDRDNGTIKIEGTNFDRITWVSNGNVIKREENITSGTAMLDLYSDDLLDDPYLYIRFYITGENGICYAQPFVLSVEGEEFTPVDVPETHDVSTDSIRLSGCLNMLHSDIMYSTDFSIRIQIKGYKNSKDSG